MVRHTFLDHCWICGQFFQPKGQAQEERHHIVPRAYGGVDGPQVSLCTTCHTRIHKVAGCLMRKLPYFELTQGLDSEQLKKTLYLATCIMNAESIARNDPNKKTVVVLSLMGGETAKLDKLKKALVVPSREAVLKVALDSLYKKHFIE